MSEAAKHPDEQLAQARRLQDEGREEDALALLRELTVARPDDPAVNFAHACALDGLGRERQAIPHYERAIERGLTGDDLQMAYVNLGSSYRAVGDYDEAMRVWQRALERFPENRALQVFHAMSLYNTGNAALAMGILLNNLAEISGDPWISRYHRAIAFYADRLDETWDPE